METGGSPGASPGAFPDRTPETAAEPVPAFVLRAVRVMYGGAAASAAGIFVNLTALNTLRRRTAQASWPSAERQAIAEFIVGGIVVAAVWTFMAVSCRAGARWARISSTVLFAVDTVYTAVVVLGVDRTAADPGVRAWTGVIWLFGLAAVILLWHRTATSHFRPGRLPRHPDRSRLRCRFCPLLPRCFCFCFSRLRLLRLLRAGRFVYSGAPAYAMAPSPLSDRVRNQPFGYAPATPMAPLRARSRDGGGAVAVAERARSGLPPHSG